MSNKDAATTSYGQGRKTLSSYMKGLLSSLIFTFSAFSLVIYKPISVHNIYILLAVLAVLQLIAQVAFFLRMNTSAEGRWNLMPFIFTIVIVLVLVFGSLWIMFNLNYNMVH